jgi:hypothetical protein
MVMHELTDRQWETSLRDARSAIDQLACAKTALMPALIHEIARKLEGRVSREVMENLERGVRNMLGKRNTWRPSEARSYLQACIEGIAEEFAEAFAEDVATEAQAHIDEYPPHETVIVTGGE